MTKLVVTALVSCIAFTAACKKKEAAVDDKAAKPAESPAAPAAKPAPAAPAAPAAPLAFKRLGSLPLEAEVPGDANIEDKSPDAGFPTVTIYASPTTFVLGGDDVKPTIEAAKAELAKDPNKLKAVTKEEKTADGWVIELTRDSLAEPGKELFGVAVRRTINGTAWDCGTNGMSADERARAEKLCTSLRAAK